MLTKAECVMSLAGLYSADENNEHVEEYVEVLSQLIDEHFNNPPLKFEEIKDNMIVWDNGDEEFIKCFTWSTDRLYYYKFGDEIPYVFEFEEGRYFR